MDRKEKTALLVYIKPPLPLKLRRARPPSYSGYSLILLFLSLMLSPFYSPIITFPKDRRVVKVNIVI
jgi:hypothetical protein